MLAGGEPDASSKAGLGGFVALVAAENEIDGRQHSFLLEPINDLDARRWIQPARAMTAAAAATTFPLVRALFCEPHGHCVGSVVDQRGQ